MAKILVKLKKGNKVLKSATHDHNVLSKQLVKRELIAESIALHTKLKQGLALHYVDYSNGKRFNVSVYPLVGENY